jgi:hypothetical protein
MPYADYEKQKEHARQYYWKNRERRLQQSKDYYYENWEYKQKQRSEWLERNKDKIRLWKVKYYKEYYKSPEKKERRALSVKKWLSNNIDKRLAHYQARNARRRGELIRPEFCNLCGEKKRLHGHHADYSRPLEVIWLCSMCHKSIHKEKRNG